LPDDGFAENSKHLARMKEHKQSCDWASVFPHCY